jgi:hypothetical protein
METNVAVAVQIDSRTRGSPPVRDQARAKDDAGGEAGKPVYLPAIYGQLLIVCQFHQICIVHGFTSLMIGGYSLESVTFALPGYSEETKGLCTRN